MRALAVPAAGIAIADQASPFGPQATVTAQGEATDVLEGSVDEGDNWETIVTFTATLRFYTFDLGEYTHLRASSADVIYLLGN